MKTEQLYLRITHHLVSHLLSLPYFIAHADLLTSIHAFSDLCVKPIDNFRSKKIASGPKS